MDPELERLKREREAQLRAIGSSPSPDSIVDARERERRQELLNAKRELAKSGAKVISSGATLLSGCLMSMVALGAIIVLLIVAAILW